MNNIRSINETSVKGLKVLVRCDFDVPMTAGKISDDSRLISGISTIEYLLEEGASVIAIGHMGRPEGFDRNLSLEPIAKWFGKQFETDIEATQVEGFAGWLIKENFVVLENLRFYKGEEEGDLEFAKTLADLADIYVNEAFGACHRRHASIVGVPKIINGFAGFHLIKEVKVLSQILRNPKRPLTFIMGGAKIETKLPLISKMHTFADYILVGGELAENTKILFEEEHRKIRGKKGNLVIAELTPEKTDITLESLGRFENIIKDSRMIVWNGPMGVVEMESLGEKDSGFTTLTLAEKIIRANSYKVVGGGDTVGFLSAFDLKDKFNFVSVGGGAMLEFLSGDTLPGLEALES